MKQLLPLKTTFRDWPAPVKNNLKRKELLVIILFLLLLAGPVFAQTVTLNIKQDYTLPETPAIKQNGDTLKSSVSTGNQWYKDGAKIEGATQSSVVITHSGTYSVTATNSAGCSSASANYAAIRTGVETIPGAGFACKVFPNPNDGYFTIELTATQSGQAELTLFAVDGRRVASRMVQTEAGMQHIRFGEPNLVNGAYTLQIRLGASVVSKKLIIKR